MARQGAARGVSVAARRLHDDIAWTRRSLDLLDVASM
jgi:hypothetical protein